MDRAYVAAGRAQRSQTCTGRSGGLTGVVPWTRPSDGVVRRQTWRRAVRPLARTGRDSSWVKLCPGPVKVAARRPSGLPSAVLHRCCRRTSVTETGSAPAAQETVVDTAIA